MRSSMRFLMYRCSFAVVAWTTAAGAQPVVMDRVAVVIGRRVVKSSDIERDLRGSQFLNRQPLDLSDEAKRKVSDRLIEQTLIRQEIENGTWGQPSQEDVDTFIARIRQQRFSGSDAQFNAGLARYGLTLDQFRQYVRWQLTVLRFIDERFRPGVLVTDEDVRAWFDQHRAELAKQYPGKNTLEALTPIIRENLTGERVNQAFEEWLTQARRQARVQYRPAAFGGQAPATTAESGADTQ